MPRACSVMSGWQSCQSSSSTLLASSMPSFVRCRFTPGSHRASVKPLSVNTRPFMNDSGDRFALAQSRLSSRHGAARREMATATGMAAERPARRRGVARRGPRLPASTVRGTRLRPPGRHRPGPRASRSGLSRARKPEREPGNAKGPGWFVNRRLKIALDSPAVQAQCERSDNQWHGSVT